MLKNYLPTPVYNEIKKYLDLVDLNEIRMRVDAPIIVTVKNRKYYLGENGFCDKEKAIIMDYISIQSFVYNLCENSVYTINDYLKCGYITLPHGIRVGITGEVVYENGQVKTIKNFQAVNIRIPHIIRGCSLTAFDYIVSNDKFLNTLIVSAPGCGKTTFIRDIVYQLNKHNYPLNVLIADERNEIVNINSGEKNIDLGDFCDVYTNSTKQFAFSYGIRSMRPDLIVTDEIDIDRDFKTITDALNSGVKVLATIHAEDIKQLKNKRGFEDILSNKLFDRYIVLTSINGPGTLSAIYDSKLQCIYAGK